MHFEQIKIGGDRNFSYLLADETTGDAAVADPSYDPDRMVDRAEELGFAIRYLLQTHGHIDHVNGNGTVLERTGAQLIAYAPRGAGRAVTHGDELPLGTLTLKVLHTPGHTDDSVCFLIQKKLITGDTLFVGKVGGTGFGDDARQEYASLHEKLLILPDDVEVFPGHDYGVAPASTIGRERATNPFLLRDSFETFVDLKKNWAQYKLEHGID